VVASANLARPTATVAWADPRQAVRDERDHRSSDAQGGTVGGGEPIDKV
jgi:hypothetical protein